MTYAMPSDLALAIPPETLLNLPAGHIGINKRIRFRDYFGGSMSINDNKTRQGFEAFE